MDKDDTDDDTLRNLIILPNRNMDMNDLPSLPDTETDEYEFLEGKTRSKRRKRGAESSKAKKSMKSQILTDEDSDAELPQVVKDFKEGSIKQKRRPTKVSRESKKIL